MRYRLVTPTDTPIEFEAHDFVTAVTACLISGQGAHGASPASGTGQELPVMLAMGSKAVVSKWFKDHFDNDVEGFFASVMDKRETKARVARSLMSYAVSVPHDPTVDHNDICGYAHAMGKVYLQDLAEDGVPV